MVWKDKKIEGNMPKINKYEVKGWNEVSKIAHTIICHSAWFAVEPLPDDMWEISIKSDFAHILEDHLKKAGIALAWRK